MARVEDGSEPDGDGADALARRLAGVHLDLAHARDEHELLGAVVRAVAPYGPIIVDLHELDVDDRGVPITSRPRAAWYAGHFMRDHPMLGQHIELASDPLSALWIAAPEEALMIADLTADPRCSDGLRARLAPRRAIAVLPLRSHPDVWQGMVTLHWHDPHTPGADERVVYRLLMHTVAAFIADRRAFAAHTAALAELRALHRISARIGEAADPGALLRAVVEEARCPGAIGKLMAIETDADGQPRSLTMLAIHGGPPPLEDRFDLASTNITPMWMAQANRVLVVEDLHSDPRFDDASRAVHLRNGSLSAILLPLRWQDRWLGLLQLAWPTPRVIDADERRLYEAIATQTAAVLDNRLLLADSEQALADSREQARVLEIVLDHLPIGVQIQDVATGERSLNRAGAALLAGHEDIRAPLPLYHVDSDDPVAPEERLSRMAIISGEAVTRERDLQDPDGTRRRLTVTSVPIQDEHGEVARAVTLFHDITARVAGELERARLHEAIIAAQRAALAERSTPLIPVHDAILVMPLIGAIDPERGRQIVATLAGAGEHARAVLIDLTGVRELDAAGAQALVEAARVVRLRGATAIFTGIRADVAWTLVEQGPGLGDLVTRPTLAAGLAHAAGLLRL